MEYSNSELEFFIDEWIHSERDRKLLKRRLIDKVKFADLAEEFNYTVRHTQRIYSNAFNELHKHLK